MAGSDLSGAHPVTVQSVLSGYAGRGSIERRDVERVRQLAPGHNDVWSRSTPLHVTASAMVVHPPSLRVLLRWHERQQAWLQVGGHGDPGETDPVAIALREGLEETGLTDLTPWPGQALLHVAVVPVPASATEPAHEHADLRFALATTEPGRIRPENPTAQLRWLTIPQARDLTAEANLRETLSRVARILGAP